ncbi:MAG TPA: Hsp20/alpha crystallin family protein [Candidatus Tripitaka californicus]|uniref:Hsp20/alpha crystallin family protein n=1 Tax=Candidatus Tripitaka californicus TaxID=3367616 RepID=UPI004026B71C|nr:Hsp20 family protein [Planctomycetota bacterium]
MYRETMPRPLKGLRDIKTHLTAHRPALRLRMNIGTISKPLHPRQTPQREVKRELSRAWLFTPEPNFARYQRNLDVLKVEHPDLDVFHEVDSLILVAQIPGTHEKAIKIEINGDVLRLEADAMTRGGHVRYYKEVLLPFEVDTSDLSSSYKDGILQMELKRPKGVDG